MVPRDNDMDELDLELDNNISFVKKHEEILEMIEEIKIFEKKFIRHDFEETELEFIEVEEDVLEFIEVEEDKLEQFETTPMKKVKKKLKNDRILNASSEVQKEKIQANPTMAATFKIRFDDTGELVNIDFKKSKPKPESNRLLKFSKFRINKNGINEKTETEIGNSKKKSKFLKLKVGLGKIGKLKKAIPTREKKEDET